MLTMDSVVLPCRCQFQVLMDDETGDHWTVATWHNLCLRSANICRNAAQEIIGMKLVDTGGPRYNLRDL